MYVQNESIYVYINMYVYARYIYNIFLLSISLNHYDSGDENEKDPVLLESRQWAIFPVY